MFNTLRQQILICISAVTICNAQALQYDCGTWHANEPYVTEWNKIIDKKAKSPEWVYDEWKFFAKPYVNANYCPCGCGEQSSYFQNRIDKKTGEIQQRWKITTYYYIYKPKSEYKITEDKFK